MIRHWLGRIVVASAIAVALMLVGLIALVIWFEATTEFTGIAQTPEQSGIWNLPSTQAAVAVATDPGLWNVTPLAYGITRISAAQKKHALPRHARQCMSYFLADALVRKNHRLRSASSAAA
jgi:hypothetical protein